MGGGDSGPEHYADSLVLGCADVFAGCAAGGFFELGPVPRFSLSVRRYDLWLGYAFLALLLAYTHYFGLFTIMGQGLFVAGYLAVVHRRSGFTVLQQAARGPIVAATVIGLGWLPWLPIFVRQHSKFPTDFWVPPVSLLAVRAAAYHLLIEPESYVAAEATPIPEFCVLLFCAVPLMLLFKERIGARSASKGTANLACAAGSGESALITGTCAANVVDREGEAPAEPVRAKTELNRSLSRVPARQEPRPPESRPPESRPPEPRPPESRPPASAALAA